MYAILEVMLSAIYIIGVTELEAVVQNWKYLQNHFPDIIILAIYICMIMFCNISDFFYNILLSYIYQYSKHLILM